MMDNALKGIMSLIYSDSTPLEAYNLVETSSEE